jgi:cytochrome c oxidase subunit I+III
LTTVSKEALERAWEVPPGIVGKLRSVNNNFIGLLFMGSTFFFFTVSGFDSVALRTQLAVPENDLLSEETFNQLFTTHGTAMMFLFAVPMLEAIAIYALPLMLGTRDMPFPRMSAFTIWTFIFGGLLFYASTLPDIVNFVLPGSPLPNLVPNAGWFAYPPLSDREFNPGLNIDFYLLGLGFAEVAGIAAAIEIVVSVLKMRAPGMSLARLPIFAWSMLVTAFAILVSFPAVIVATTYLELQRKFGLPFFDPERGGDPLLWQHLFWIFGHPEVYIMFLPATGLVSMVLPALARRPLAGYVFVVTALVATAFFSFGLWVHHMFTAGLPLALIGFFGAASMTIAFPSGVQTFSWLATLLSAPRIVMRTPMLYVLAFIATFVLGGITGVMVAAVPFDWQTHDTYFVVAHFHYVLVGGVVFPIAAGLYYYWPKFTGRLLDERLGRWGFWLVFVGFNLCFLPQHVAGLLGMPRRVATYPEEMGLGGYNLASTAGAYVMAAGFLLHGIDLALAVWQGRKASADPWDAPGLEWIVDSPAPPYNHREIPLVTGRDQRAPAPWRPERTRPVARGPVWRETLVTSAIEGRVQGVAVLAGDSIAPFALAVTFTIVSAALLFEIYAVALVFTLASIPPLVRWLWPSRAQRELPGAGASLGSPDLDAYANGAASTSWWAMLLTLASLGATHALALFSYFYLAYANPLAAAVRVPSPVAAAFAVVLLASAAGASRVALARIRGGDRSGLLVALGASVVAGLAAGAVLARDLLALGLRPIESANDAMFATLAWYQVALVVTALVVSGFVGAQAFARHFDERRHVAVENVLLLWLFVAGSAALTVLALYVSPHLL